MVRGAGGADRRPSVNLPESRVLRDSTPTRNKIPFCRRRGSQPPGILHPGRVGGPGKGGAARSRGTGGDPGTAASEKQRIVDLVTATWLGKGGTDQIRFERTNLGKVLFRNVPNNSTAVNKRSGLRTGHRVAQFNRRLANSTLPQRRTRVPRRGAHGACSGDEGEGHGAGAGPSRAGGRTDRGRDRRSAQTSVPTCTAGRKTGPFRSV